MPRTTVKQKISLIVLSLVLTLILLEAGLRIAGAWVVSLQEKRNAAALAGSSFRILCIGESTTAIGGNNSYPSQLAEILAAKYPGKKISVINKGMIGATSEKILSHLEENLNKYKPAVVIGMIGINDPHDDKSNILFRDYAQRFWTNWYSIRFLKFLAKHLYVRIHEILTHEHPGPKILAVQEQEPQTEHGNPQEILKAIADFQRIYDQLIKQYSHNDNPTLKNEITDALFKIRRQQYFFILRLVKYYRVREDYSTAENYLKKALALFPDDDLGYFQLAMMYKAQKEYSKAIPIFENIVHHKSAIAFAKIELAYCYKALGQDKDVLGNSDAMTQPPSNTLSFNRDIADQLREHQHYKQAEVVYQKALEENPYDPSLYENIAQTYRHLGNPAKADFFENKAKALRIETARSLPMTVYNYQKIVDMVFSCGAQFIAMQYPLRSIKPLKEILNSKKFVVYVENKENFEKALTHSAYSEYFSDSFAGDFGHCTIKGNHLIAKNLADVIQREVLKDAGSVK